MLYAHIHIIMLRLLFCALTVAKFPLQIASVSHIDKPLQRIINESSTMKLPETAYTESYYSARTCAARGKVVSLSIYLSVSTKIARTQ